MEPKTPGQSNQTSKNSAPDMNSTVSDLHNEGVDIMDGGVSTYEPEAPAEVKSQDTSASAPPAEPVKPIRPAAVEQVPRPTPAAFRVQIPVPQPQPQAPAPSNAQAEINQALGAASSGASRPLADLTKNDPSIKPLRTFKSDAEEAVRYQNISAAQIAIAEQKKRQGSSPIELEPRRSPALIIFLVMILLLLGAGGAYYYWAFIMEQGDSGALPQELRVQTLLPYARAEVVGVDTAGGALETLALAIKAANLTPNSVYAPIPVPTSTTTAIARVNQIFQGSRMPDMLARSLAEQYMIGAYFQETPAPFVIFKNTYFQNAFAGMLEWEKDMKNDLIHLIRVSHPDELAGPGQRSTFEDIIISNTDIRTLKNAEGTVILAYAFTDKDTLVISTEIEVLKILIDRLLAVRVIQ
jgi:hypothetical protein